ncbi:hypothetical protein ACYSNM_10810 [Myroides sp. LJL116]
MDYTTANKQIKQTFNDVSAFVLKLKRSKEVIVIDSILDSTLKLQSVINKDCLFLENLIELFEKKSWIDDITDSIKKEETLYLINAIISMTRDIHRLVLERYLLININAKEFASGEIKRLKLALDGIKETCIDLEDIYVLLPVDKYFQQANDRLQIL